MKKKLKKLCKTLKTKFGACKAAVKANKLATIQLVLSLYLITQVNALHTKVDELAIMTQGALFLMYLSISSQLQEVTDFLVKLLEVFNITGS